MTAREAFLMFSPSERPRIKVAPDALAGLAGRWHCVSPQCVVSAETPEQAYLRWLTLLDEK